MKWNAREGKRRFIETMIDTLKISGSQLGKYKDLMTILKISDEVKTYLLQTATVENCEINDKELLDIFPNDGAKGKRDFKHELKMLNSWMQKQKENDNLEKYLLSDIGKINLGLNLANLLVEIARAIYELSHFASNKKEIKELLKSIRMDGGGIVLKLMDFNEECNRTDDDGADFFNKTGILISSIILNYDRILIEEVDKSIRYVIDLFN